MSVNQTLSRSMKVFFVLGLLMLTAAAALAQDGSQPQRERSSTALPSYITAAQLDAPVQSTGTEVLNRLNSSLVDAAGQQRVVVRLSSPPMSLVVARGARGADQTAALDAIAAQQTAVIDSALALDSNARVLGTVRMALNAVMLKIDASALVALAANPDVVSVNPVVDYEMDLSETVPYIGASYVQDEGFDGTGVKVAVLDSGVDYIHADLGGSGSVTEYNDNDPNIIETGTFPTDRIAGGTDFVGSTWPDTDEVPDPDPLDDGSESGHGTHVSDIIGGVNGVAPGSELYAVKVCSSVSTSCSGVALINAMDWVLDPDGNGNMDDRMDVINMSLGSNMGNPVVDDLSFAVENASAVGLLSVVSAGNGSDIAYMHGTAASAPSALSVAQTNVPSAVQPIMEVTKPNSIAGDYVAIFQPWSAPLDSKIMANLVYGDTGNTNLDGCLPFSGNMNNKIVLVDRGACNFSLKIKNISDAGAEAGIIGLIAPGDPFSGGDGGERPIDIPGFMISQADANTLRSGLNQGVVTIVFDPAEGIALVQHMVGSSSRGPSIQLNGSKPDIGAPGASISAIAGSGEETGPFGGTSGAAPMVTGAAALIMEAYPDRSWAEVKSVLMNTGETDIMNSPEFFGGELAPISRIGGGEVRVDRAYDSAVAAWDADALTGSLSFGFHDITDGASEIKDVVVHNYTGSEITYDIDYGFRFADDEASAVSLNLPASVTVPANSSTTIAVELVIEQTESATLHPWEMNSGSRGATPAWLTYNEYDGYIYFSPQASQRADVAGGIHMAFHVLPRAAGDIQIGVDGNTDFVRNTGKADSYVDTFSLLAISPELPDGPAAPGSNEQLPDFRYLGVQTYSVPAGECGPSDSFIMGFAINTWERQTHANPTSFQIYLDVDEDGNDDYLLLNRDFTLNNVTDGRNLSWVVDLATNDAEAFFYTNHNTNSGNTVLLLCGDQIGLDASDFGTTSIGVSAFAQDFYFTGAFADAIEGINVVPLGERFFTAFDGSPNGYIELPALSDEVPYIIQDFSSQLNESETGVLWLNGPGAPADNEAKAIVLVDTSATISLPVIVRP